MIVFVNGKIGFGSPPAGRVFWENPGSAYSFIDGAVKFFEDDETHFIEIDYSHISTAKQRFKLGMDAAEKLTLLKEQPQLNFVSFSMGAAYAEGMAQWCEAQNLPGKKVVHINAFQAAKVPVKKVHRELTIDYQLLDDPVTRNVFLRLVGFACTGDIAGADILIRDMSGVKDWKARHRSPLWKQQGRFWERLLQNIRHKKSSQNHDQAL